MSATSDALNPQTLGSFPIIEYGILTENSNLNFCFDICFWTLDEVFVQLSATRVPAKLRFSPFGRLVKWQARQVIYSK